VHVRDEEISSSKIYFHGKVLYFIREYLEFYIGDTDIMTVSRRTRNVLLMTAAGGLALSAHTAAAQQWWQVPSMPGGNGLCSDPASLGPNAPTAGGYAPVTTKPGKFHSLSVAKRGTALYLSNSSLQIPEDVEIISLCQPDSDDILKTVIVTGACQQVVDGINYMVESTMTIPCSEEDIATLPDGTDLTRSILSRAYKPLPVNGQSQSPQIVDVQGVTTGEATLPGAGFCPEGDPGTPGGWSMVDNASQNKNLLDSAKNAASVYFTKDASNAFKNAVKICKATKQDFVNSVQVTEGCSQVVRGTNYQIRFVATIPCNQQNSAKLPAGYSLKQGFEAGVFVPFGSGAQGPKVTYVANTGGVIG
jgi:hypothetical protein